MVDLIRYHDPELEALRYEIQALERQVREAAQEKVGMLELMSDFCRRQFQALGSLTTKLLLKTLAKLRAQLAEHFDEHLEARIERTEQQLEAFRQESGGQHRFSSLLIANLDEEQEQMLRETFRAALRICHPDAAPPALKERAETITKALVSAYRLKNLLAVQDIHLQLTLEGLSGTEVATHGARKLLGLRREALLGRLAQERSFIATLKEAKSYRTASGIEDWEVYFSAAREALERKLAAFANEEAS
ncbi:MAG: hypothetical protein JKY65_27185 [Planctomycetes bacterium]|nr:hypothetical protein [Planctomycetota bacterium]